MPAAIACVSPPVTGMKPVKETEGRTGVGFVGVHDEIMRTLFHFLRHEGPLQARWKASAAAAAQTGVDHLLDHLLEAPRHRFEVLGGRARCRDIALELARSPGMRHLEVPDRAIRRPHRRRLRRWR